MSFRSFDMNILISSSKKIHNQSAIIHLWRLWRCIIGEIWKIHWKSMIKKHQYCCANTSSSKDRIFMKSKTSAHEIVIDHNIKFNEDPSFRLGDIRKTILVFFNISSIMHLQSLQIWIITEYLWTFFETTYQNVHI